MLEPDPRILDTAERLFRERGYHEVVLAEIATAAGIALPAVQMHYPEKAALLHALLERHNPRQAIKQAFRQLRGGNPEEMIRHALQELLITFDNHALFAYFAMLDAQLNDGRYVKDLLQELTTEAASFLNSLSTMPRVRPISTVMLGRALASFLIGFMATQLFAPEGARFSLRVFPQKTWVDGMTDVILHGILESDSSA